MKTKCSLSITLMQFETLTFLSSRLVTDTAFAFSILFRMFFFIFNKFLFTSIHDCLIRSNVCGWMKSIIVIQFKVTDGVIQIIIIFWWSFTNKNIELSCKRFYLHSSAGGYEEFQNMLNMYLKSNWLIILFLNSAPLSVDRDAGKL